MTATAGGTTTNVRGPGVFIRIRELDNTKTITGNNCNQPNTTTTGAVTQQRNVQGNNVKQPNTTTTGAVVQVIERYWVGGTGTWDASDTTHWSATNGGAGGASVPTDSTDVYFNANSNTGTSAFTVTVTGNMPCFKFTVSGLDGALTFGGSGRIYIYGDFSSPASGVDYTLNTLTFLTATTQNIDTGALSLNCPVSFSGVGTKVLTSNLLAPYGIDLAFGTLNSNGKNISTGGFSSAYNNVRAFSMPPVMTITASAGYFVTTGTNLTVTHNSGSLVYTGSGAIQLQNQGHNLYDLSIQSRAVNQTVQINTNDFGATFSLHNFEFYQTDSNGTRAIQIGNDTGIGSQSTITISGTLSINASGSDVRSRTYFRSGGAKYRATKATLNVAAVSGLLSCDFQGITVGGAASPISGTSIGNCAGNTGITFTASKTVYLVGTGSPALNDNIWATSSGGTPAVANYPLGQDKAIVNADSANAGLIFAGGFLQDFDSTAKSSMAVQFYRTFEFTGNNGSVKFNSNTTFSYYQSCRFTGGGTTTFQPPTDFQNDIEIFSFDNTQSLQLIGNFYSSNKGVILYRNKLDLNNYNWKSTTFSTDAGQTIASNLTFGTGKFSVTATGYAFGYTTPALLTIAYSAGAILEFTSSSGGTGLSGSTGGLSLPTLNLGGSSDVYINTAQTFYNVTNTVQPASLTLKDSATITFSNFSLRGTAGNLVTVQSSSTSFQTTLSKSSGIVDCDYLYIRDNNATGGATWYAGANSTNFVNNTGWIFTGAPVTITLTGNNCNQPNTTTTGAINRTLTLTGTNCKTTPTSSTGAISQTHVLTGANCKTTPTSSTGAINRVLTLTGNNCNQPNTTTTGAINRVLSLTGNNVNQPNTTTTGAISRTLTLTGNSVNQSNTSTTGRIARVQTITGNNCNQPNTTTTGRIARVQTLTGNNCNQSNRTSTGAITRSQTITGNNVNQPNATTSGAINRVLSLTGNSVNQRNTSTSGAINRVLSITGNNCNQPNTSTTGAINRTLTLTGNNCQQVNKSTSASISQTHQLTGASCQQSNRSTSGAISQIHILTGANCQQSNRSTTGAINRVLTLTGNSVQQVNRSTSGGISQTHKLTGANCNQPNSASTGAINRVLTLTGNNVQQSNRSTVGAVVQTQTLSGNSVNQSNQSTQGAISQTHLLAGNNVNQPNQTTTGAIGGTITLTGNNVNQSNTSTTGAINQVLTLTGNSVQQANQTTNGSIGQAHNIHGNNVRQLNQSTTGAIGQVGDLIGNSVTQHNRSTSGVITQTHRLSGANCQQANESSVGGIKLVYSLTGNSVQQPNTSSTGYVEQIHVLQGFNCNQFNRSTSGHVVVPGVLLGADCIQVNISTSDRIHAYPVENAPAGSAFNRYRFNPNRPTSSNTTRPDFTNTQRPSNTNVIGPL
jgi:hypothetical protein